MKTLLTCAIVALLVWPQQTRDTSAVIPTGTAALSGTVVTDDADARPVRMATVRISGSAITAAQTETTDASGAFVFRNLPAGRYSIEASRAGFLDTEYGAKRVGGSGVPIVIDAGGSASVVVKLPRGAVIAGRLTGPDGEPAANVAVRLFRVSMGPTGERKLEFGGPEGWRAQGATDDRGEYRFYGVSPGEYVIAGVPPSGQGGSQISSTELDWARRQLMPNAPGGTGGTVPSPGPFVSLAPVLFPGVIEPAAATVVNVATGEERTDVDFTLQYVPTATISGVVLDQNGLPPAVVQVNMLAPTYSIFLGPAGVIRPGPDGRFTTSGVLPGQYMIAARGAPGAPAGATGAAPSMASNAPLLPLWALLTLTVDGRDISDLQVTLQPGVGVSGRIVFDGSIAPPPDPARVRLALTAVQSGSVSVGVPDAQGRADGTFMIPGVAPGRYRVGATISGSPAPAWSLRSVMLAGVDTLDAPLDVRVGEGVSDVVVHFTDKPTEITGTLFGADGKPAPEFFIVVFSTDRTHWIPQSRRVRSARPGTTGTFRIANLPPGEYYLCALTDLDSSQISLASSTFLEALAAASFKISLAEGQKLTQDVQVKR